MLERIAGGAAQGEVGAGCVASRAVILASLLPADADRNWLLHVLDASTELRSFLGIDLKMMRGGVPF